MMYFTLLYPSSLLFFVAYFLHPGHRKVDTCFVFVEQRCLGRIPIRFTRNSTIGEY